MNILKKFKFLFFVLIGILIFLWVYEFFAGPQSIDVITKNYDKLYLLQNVEIVCKLIKFYLFFKI